MTGEDIARVLAHYDIGRLRSCRRAGHGYVNDNWIVETTADRYFLKRRHPSLKKPRLISAQHALIRHLGSVEFPAPAIILTRQGTTFLELQGEIYEIYEYIPGDLCDPARPAHFAAAARTLGWYHTAVKRFDHQFFHQPSQRYTPARLVQIINRLMNAWQGRTSPALDPLIENLWKHARDLTARFDEFEDLPELIVHGDYYAENLIFQGDEVGGVVDYDLARRSWRATELAEALIYFTAERPGKLEHIVYPGVLDLDEVYKFLVAYAQTARLWEPEIHVLPHLIRTIWLCASLEPPLKPPLRVEAAPQALPEVLTLAGWAETHTPDIVDAGLAVRANQAI